MLYSIGLFYAYKKARSAFRGAGQKYNPKKPNANIVVFFKSSTRYYHLTRKYWHPPQ